MTALDPTALGWRLGDPAALAFGGPGPKAAERPVWRLEVSGPASSWDAALGARRSAVDEAARREVEAARRLDAFLATPADLAFATGTAATTPESELALLLAPSTDQDGLAFGWLDGIQTRWHGMVDRLQAALDQVGRFLGGLAVAETVIDGVPVARTAMRLDGDLRTAWRRDVTRSAAALHAGSIATAQAARRQVARTLRLVFEGAALLATLPALATNPAGLMVALPAIWHFIERVTAEAGPA